MGKSICKICGAEIIWIETPGGEMMPCDPGLHFYQADPKGRGRVVVYAGSDSEGRVARKGTVLACRWHAKGDRGGMGYVPHWATCKRKAKAETEQTKLF